MEAMPSGGIVYPARVVELFAVDAEAVERVAALAGRGSWALLKRLGYPPAVLRPEARNAAFDVDLRRVAARVGACYQPVADFDPIVRLAEFLAAEHGVNGNAGSCGDLMRRLKRQPGTWLVYEDSPELRAALADVTASGAYATWCRQQAARLDGDGDESSVHAAAAEMRRALEQLPAGGVLLVRSHVGAAPYADLPLGAPVD
jgi:hypothetical protein